MKFRNLRPWEHQAWCWDTVSSKNQWAAVLPTLPLRGSEDQGVAVMGFTVAIISERATGGCRPQRARCVCTGLGASLVVFLGQPCSLLSILSPLASCRDQGRGGLVFISTDGGQDKGHQPETTEHTQPRRGTRYGGTACAVSSTSHGPDPSLRGVCQSSTEAFFIIEGSQVEAHLHGLRRVFQRIPLMTPLVE